MRQQTSPIMDLRNLDFLLYELIGIQQLTAHARFSDHDRDTLDGALQLAHELSLKHFWPSLRRSDMQEPCVVDGQVQLPDSTATALAAYIEAGFLHSLSDYDEGGMQLPYPISMVCDMLFQAGNLGTTAYALLSKAAANLLRAHASPEQQARYMRPILNGQFYGTMCLSEPQAGSALADLRTRATPLEDGRYRIDGAKMWISGGEHELAENIVHLVLARIDGAPPGAKGISLFIVPRRRLQEDGSTGADNDVRLAGLNHKMGYRGCVNTFLKFGENGDCIGELIGAPHQGLAQMFHMMNESRIGVGNGSIMLGTVGYLHSLAYARERPQGRHPDQKDPSSPPLAIIQHADVRRMLLAQRVWTEGALALTLYTTTLVDAHEHAAQPQDRRDAWLLLELLTPIVKAWSSEWCTRANELAIQVLGGYGYTREYPVEQLYRDNRLNAIHEGTNGIQALDLLGRKIHLDRGRALQMLGEMLEKDLLAAMDHAELHDIAQALQQAWTVVGACTQRLATAMQAGETRKALAHASAYLELFGHTVIAWQWLRQAHCAAAALTNGPRSDTDRDFYLGKIASARYFARYELPRALAQAELLTGLDDCTLMMRDEWF